MVHVEDKRSWVLTLLYFQVEEAVAVLQAHQAKESAHQQAASNANMAQQVKKD